VPCEAVEVERVRQAAEAERARQAAQAERAGQAAAEAERARQAERSAKKEAMISEHGLASIVGQEETVKRLRAFASLFSGTDAIRGHILLTGPAGTGKRTVARAFAVEYCHNLVESIGSGLVKSGDLMGVLTNLAQGDGMLIGGIDRMSKECAGFLIPAVRDHKVDFVLDKGMFAKTVNVPLQPFTLIATTETASAVPPDLTECFHLTVPLVPRYSDAALATICQRIARHAGLVVAQDAANLIAGAAHGSPHQVQVMVRKLSGLGKAAIEADDAAQLLSVLGLGPRPRAQGELATEEVDTLSGIEFERLVTGLLDAMGFRTEMTKASGDGGIDIVASSERLITGGKYLFQCKRYAPGNLVGSPTVREFYGAVRADPEAVKGILITTSGFTQQALEFARQLPIELIAGDKLRELLTEYQLTRPCPPSK
jgi:Holliday junction resolvasome RuvABC ATP-dependent DNA helicase subunit